MKLLEIEGVSKSFGGISAVKDVSFRLEEGEIRAIIGPNGAGKTTLVSLISGRLRPQAGRIRFRSEDITEMPVWRRVMRGIVYVFQITSIYPRLSCYENVALAAQRRLLGKWQNQLCMKERKVAIGVEDALQSVGLLSSMNRAAGELAYGHQRLIELAMGFALKPSLLILDEPTQGLAAGEIENFCTLMRSVTPSTTILIIEHNIKVVLELATRITVMDQGSVLAEGEPHIIERHPAVQEAYLGS
jgi:branched-chain amino acid transport system ATP-binding protein